MSNQHFDRDHQPFADAARWAVQGSDPATPASTIMLVYAKADGMYVIDDAGIVRGPFVTLKKLASQTVNIAATDIAHGLGYIPLVVLLTPRSLASFYEYADADITNIRLMASANGQTVDIYVG